MISNRVLSFPFKKGNKLFPLLCQAAHFICSQPVSIIIIQVWVVPLSKHFLGGGCPPHLGHKSSLGTVQARKLEVANGLYLKELAWDHTGRVRKTKMQGYLQVSLWASVGNRALPQIQGKLAPKRMFYSLRHHPPPLFFQFGYMKHGYLPTNRSKWHHHIVTTSLTSFERNPW